MGSRAGVLRSAAGRHGLTETEYLGRLAAGQRPCTKCRRWLDRSAYQSDRSRGSGVAATCRECRYRRRTPGPTKAEREFARGFGHEWCRRCEAWLSADAVHAGLCRPHTNAERREVYASNEAFRLHQRQRVHARKRNVGAIPGRAQVEIREDFGGLCGYCRTRPATTWDHVVPISKGGRTTPGNVVPACLQCNSSKHDRDVHEWMEEKGYEYADLLVDRLVLADAGLYG